MTPPSPEPLRRLFGRRVRELRIRLGLTQQELGRRARMHPAYVGGVERGERNITLDGVERLARALSVSPAELMMTTRGEATVGTVESRLRALILRSRHPDDLELAIDVAALVIERLNAAREAGWAAEKPSEYGE